MAEQQMHPQQNPNASNEAVYDHIAKVRHLVWSLKESLSVRLRGVGYLLTVLPSSYRICSRSLLRI